MHSSLARRTSARVASPASNHFVSRPSETTMPSEKKNFHAAKLQREHSDQLSNLPFKKMKIDSETSNVFSCEDELKPAVCVWNWNVRNSDLRTKDRIMSPRMSFPGSSYTFEIWLTPKAPITSSGEPRYVSLQLNVIEPTVAEISYRLTVWKNGTQIFAYTSQRVFGPKQYNSQLHGAEKFVECELFKKRLDQVASLSEQFTIRCDIVHFETPESLKRMLKIDESANCFKDEKFGDVKLIVEDRKLKAHGLLLIDASRVFTSMINSEEKILTIQDTCYETMLQVLFFIYSGRVGALNDTRVKDIYVAAKGYELDRLKNICEDYMCKNLCIDKLFDFLHFSELHDLGALRERAQTLLISQRERLSRMPDPELLKNIMSVSRETLAKILSGIIKDVPSANVEESRDARISNTQKSYE